MPIYIKLKKTHIAYLLLFLKRIIGIFGYLSKYPCPHWCRLLPRGQGYYTSVPLVQPILSSSAVLACFRHKMLERRTAHTHGFSAFKGKLTDLPLHIWHTQENVN